MDSQKLQLLQAEYSQPDHWNYTTDPYELRKYEQTLALIPRQRYAAAVELGCSEGFFTRGLAALADRVVGLDVVPVAVERARSACADLDNIEFRVFDMETDDLAERFDLVVCAEVLYYLPRRKLRPTIRKISRWPRPGGYLVAVHVRSDVAAGWGFGPKGAELTHRLFERPSLVRVLDQDEGSYVLSLYRKLPEPTPTAVGDLLEDLRSTDYLALGRAAAASGLRLARRLLSASTDANRRGGGKGGPVTRPRARQSRAAETGRVSDPPLHTPLHAKPGTRNQKPETRNQKLGTRNSS